MSEPQLTRSTSGLKFVACFQCLIIAVLTIGLKPIESLIDVHTIAPVPSVTTCVLRQVGQLQPSCCRSACNANKPPALHLIAKPPKHCTQGGFKELHGCPHFKAR
eukprot:TRINITY_DN16167_c0_g1_i1.p2 TRINITY_DN16167_c0_g1~~TRINITY_DN16167_c0_g1_i1.p2  ORF type:complete len:105 (-),score=7.82 TRINITY_DN16167_c0_g1_i1:517-831(-)